MSTFDLPPKLPPKNRALAAEGLVNPPTCFGRCGALDAKILIDVPNRLNMENPPAAIDGASHAERTQQLAPAARMIKGYNATFAARQAAPRMDGFQLDGFVAAGDEQAKQQVLELVQSIGFRPVDAGVLGMTRALEAMALLNITVRIRNE